MLDNIEWIGNSVISRIYMMKIIDKHDESKNFADEYSAYDAYFYGNNKSYAVVLRKIILIMTKIQLS